MRTRVAAYGVIRDENRILLAHWNEHGRSGWTLPGGGSEGAEDPIETAVREIEEETGYVAEIDELLGIHTYVVPISDRVQRAKEPLKAMRVIYTAHVVGGELRTEVNGSTDEARWFDLDEVSSLHRVALVDIALRMARERPATGHLQKRRR